MKFFYTQHFKTLAFLTLFLTIYLPLFAQPIGAKFTNPIDAGVISTGRSFTDTKNNATANGYGNDYGQISDDIYYKFSLDIAAEVSISNCSSTFDTNCIYWMQMAT
jgi:hypothetical protein